MCPECMDERLSYSDYKKQNFYFERKITPYEERIYKCSKCGKKYYVTEKKINNLIIVAYWLLLFMIMIQLYKLSGYWLSPISSVLNITVFVLVCLALYFILFKKIGYYVKYFGWKQATIKPYTIKGDDEFKLHV